MTKYIKFLVSTIAIAATACLAEPIHTKLPIVCDDADKMFDFFKAEKEIPLLYAEGYEDPETTVTIWMSRNGAMTVTTSRKKVICILTAGEKFQLVPGAIDYLKKRRDKEL